MRKRQGCKKNIFNFLVVNQMTIGCNADAVAQIGIAHAIPAADVIHVSSPCSLSHSPVIESRRTWSRSPNSGGYGCDEVFFIV